MSVRDCKTFIPYPITNVNQKAVYTVHFDFKHYTISGTDLFQDFFKKCWPGSALDENGNMCSDSGGMYACNCPALSNFTIRDVEGWNEDWILYMNGENEDLFFKEYTGKNYFLLGAMNPEHTNLYLDFNRYNEFIDSVWNGLTGENFCKTNTSFRPKNTPNRANVKVNRMAQRPRARNNFLRRGGRVKR